MRSRDRYRILCMCPTLSDLKRTVAALPLILLLFALAQNEYLFVPIVCAVGIAFVAAFGISFRIIRRTRSHTPFWIIVFLCVYNAPMVLGGYTYLGAWLFLLAPIIFAVGFWSIRKSHPALRIATGVVAVSIFGIFSLHFHRNLDFDQTLRRCEREKKTLNPVVELVDAQKHPYDFTIVGEFGKSAEPFDDAGREKIVAAYGLGDRLRVFDGLTGALEKEIRLPREGEVQRLVPEPGGSFVYAPPWGRRGRREEIFRIDVKNGKVIDAVPVNYLPASNDDGQSKEVNGCRNVFEVVLDGNIIYALCEVSHSLVKINAWNHQIIGELKLPGLDAYDMVFDPVKRRIISTDYWSPNLVVIDADRFSIDRTLRIGWSSFGIVLHERKLFVARPLAREVVEIDADTLKIVRRIEVGYGVRDLEIDKRRGLLFAGNYYDGTVDAVDVQNGERVARLFVGSLLRGISLCVDGRFLYCATGCGVKRVEIDNWLGVEY
jgi:hypothetical protein